MKKSKMRKRLLAAVMWCLSLAVFMPLALILINSLKTPAEADAMSLSLPAKPLWSNFSKAAGTGNLLRSFSNSVMITGLSAGFSAFLGTMAGYVLGRRQDRTAKRIYSFFQLGLVIPVQIIALIEVLKKYRLMNSYPGIILVYLAMFLPLSIFLAYGFVRSVPAELDEAAVVDGCGPCGLFLRVMAPLLMPVISTSLITQAVFIWNDFQFPLYLISDSRKWTIVLGVYNFLGRYSTNWNLVCAYILISSLPIVILYLFGQKYIISGMLAGAVKG